MTIVARPALMLRLAFATSAAIGISAMSSAWAASPVPEPALDLGQTSFLDGEAGPGGLFEVIGNGYVALQFTDAAGHEARNRPRGTSAVLRLLYPL